jgi:hypothetical protein
MHVADGVDVDEEPHPRDQQQHDEGQLVHAEGHRDPERAGQQPVVEDEGERLSLHDRRGEREGSDEGKP